jgi:hypothetical protein
VPANWNVEWSGDDGDKYRRIISIDVSGEGLTGNLTLAGLTSLVSLNCSDNKIVSLNVSGCTALTELDCSYNDLTSLNVSGLSELRTLDCSYNSMSDESKVIGFTGTDMIFHPQKTTGGSYAPADDITMILIVIVAVIGAVVAAVCVLVLRSRKLKK